MYRPLTVVSGLSGRPSCMGVPPSLTILAFFRWRRRSWFFFILAISSSSLTRKNEAQIRIFLTSIRDLVDLPFLCPFVFIRVSSRCETIGQSSFFFEQLATSYIRTDHSRISDDLCFPLPVYLDRNRTLVPEP